MANSSKVSSITIPTEIKIRLKSLCRPHQAIAGVIEELLMMYDKIEKPKDIQ